MAEKEYIEREAAINEVLMGNIDKDYPRMDIAARLHDLPAADVRPVVRGRWEYNPGDNIPYCSECMMPQDSECNFCPSCGADMREES